MQLDKLEAIGYVVGHPTYYFGYGEIADYYMAPQPRPEKKSMLKDYMLENLEKLEQVQKHYCAPLLNLFSAIHIENDGEGLVVDRPSVELLMQLDGIPIICNLINKMTETSKIVKERQQSLRVEMSMKVAMNVLYLIFFNLSEQGLARTVAEVDIEDMLMKLVQASLEVSFVPIRKVVVMFYLILRSKFTGQQPIAEKEVEDLKNNIVMDCMLHAQTSGTPRLLIRQPNPVEAFYRRHNINDCTLAQYIVVGLLRALLTVCSPNKPSANNPSGVDAFREWKTSFLYASEIHCNTEGFPDRLKSLLELFVVFEANIERKEQRTQVPIVVTQLINDLDRHRIYTVAAITSFFSFLLIKFKRNAFLQYSYLIQLISDANGILVLLKFLTDKFQLVGARPLSIYDFDERFLTRVKSTIHNVLLLLLATCNNFTEKIKSFLFDYNSFLILKKLPGLFEEDPTITELSCTLLKIQIPFFTKKMKESSNNMKMITEIYCKCPKRPEGPRTINAYQRLLLKNKIKPKRAKQILLLEDVKNLHVEFNNYNYWHVQPQTSPPVCDYLQRLQKQVQLDPSFEQHYEQWLENNVWQYYD